MMKKFLLAVFMIALPAVLVAKTPIKRGSKATGPSQSRLEAKTLASQMASGIRAAEAALSPAELAIAQLIYQGKLPCELGAFVTLTADAKFPGYFDLQIKNQKFRLLPVETSIGAIRLEDRKAGAVWLQLTNKSLLMNQKLGQRLADECMSPDQAVVAELLIKAPAPGLLDALPAVVPVKESAPVILDVPLEIAPIKEAAPVTPEAPPAVAPT